MVAIPLDQCLNHPPFGEGALYLPFLGKSIGKLRALTGVCMPTLELCNFLSQGGLELHWEAPCVGAAEPVVTLVQVI